MTAVSGDAVVDRLAAQLELAWTSGRPVPPLTRPRHGDERDIAYAVQSAWNTIRLGAGDEVVGRKIGLTSRAMQEQMGVAEPDYGAVWASRVVSSSHGVAEMPVDTFIQPRVEGELAFLIGRRLAGPGVTAAHVLAVTEAVAPAVEVVDSRIQDWRIGLFDTIADNASYGGVALGPWAPALRSANLRTLGMVVSLNGRPVVEATGSAALGHPARAVAWLANRLSAHGVALEAGQMVLSGSLGRAFAVAPGDVLQIECSTQPMLTTRFR